MRARLLDAFRASGRAAAGRDGVHVRRRRPEPYTLRRLFASADAARRAARSHGLSSNAPLGILLRRQEDQVLHYLAALVAGLVPAILTPPNPKLNRAYYAETMAGVLARSRFAAVITDVEGARAFRHGAQPVRRRADRGAESGATDGPRRSTQRFLQFSSGTTGIKRGVLVTDEAVLAQIDDLRRGDRAHARRT